MQRCLCWCIEHSPSQTTRPPISSGCTSPENLCAASHPGTANGVRAKRSSYADQDSYLGSAPGGSTWLDPRLLACMVQLAVTYRYGVTEIAGGAHQTIPTPSRHYSGLAFDVYSINDVPVNSANSDVDGFKQICVSMGASYVSLEGSCHIHVQWYDNLGNVACGGGGASSPTITDDTRRLPKA